MKARLHLLALALPCLLLLHSCYVSEQASRFLALRAKARPAAAVLSDPAAPEAWKSLVGRVARIRKFAIGELGLKDTKNFTSLVVLDADRLATVVQACAELSFDRYLWSYPIVGKLPYQGFFDPKDAEEEAARLRAKGLDVIVRPVDAFSTLGWFDDPLYSFMSTYSDAELADLVIHEMTHATAFTRSPGDFNEELATFVGREGAKAWLEAVEGASSAKAKAAELARHEAEAFATFLRGTATELEALYSSSAGTEEKRSRKAAIIAERARLFKEGYSAWFLDEGYRAFRMDRINNAWLDLYRLYEGEPGLYADFERLACGGDLRRFVGEAARLARLKGDPKAAMRAALAQTGAAGY